MLNSGKAEQEGHPEILITPQANFSSNAFASASGKPMTKNKIFV
jgi:hypothetical protein